MSVRPNFFEWADRATVKNSFHLNLNFKVRKFPGILNVTSNSRMRQFAF